MKVLDDFCDQPDFSTVTASPTPFVWCGPIYEPTGYADEARGILRALHAARVPVALRPVHYERPGFRDALDPADLEIFVRQQRQAIAPPVIVCQHVTAESFVQDPTAALNIGRTMFETDSLPPHWVQHCNEMDELWLPSTFNRDTFAAAGVKTPVTVVPGGIDTDRYRPDAPPLHVDGLRGTVFLSVFEWRHRKGWDVLLRAWAEAFTPDDNVSLLLRTYPIGARDVRDRAALIDEAIDAFLMSACGRTRRDVAPIVPLTRMLSDTELPSLYTRADAYVSPTRGEGWGRTYMEAMASGRPTIATRWSAHLDFMQDSNSLLIDVDGVVEANDPDMPLYQGQGWAEPSVSHLATLLKRVHSDRAEARAIGAVARADMVSDWQWARPASVIAARLRELGVQRDGILHAARATRSHLSHDAIIVDADAFSDHRFPLDITAWLAPLVASDSKFSIAPRGAVTRRPSRTDATHAWWQQRLVSDVRDMTRGVTISVLRRSDAAVAERPGSGRWIVVAGDTINTTVPASLRDVVLNADDVWVSNSAAYHACLAAGVAEHALWQIPHVAIDAAVLTASARMLRPTGVATVFGLVVASEADLATADALVRTWERAYATSSDRVLRVVVPVAPDAAVAQWHQQLGDRLSSPMSVAQRARIEVWQTPLTDDLWPSMIRSLDILIAPSIAPAVPALWSMAAALQVLLVAPLTTESHVSDVNTWVSASAGWSVPVAATGRFNWSAFAQSVDAACDSAQRAERMHRANVLDLQVTEATDVLQMVRARLAATQVASATHRVTRS